MKNFHPIFLMFTMAFFISPIFAFGSDVKKKTVEYIKKDNQTLMMDIYSTESCTAERKPCMIFVFGGGFYEGSKDALIQLDYYNYMAKLGFVVMAIDYRLGLKDAKEPTNPEPLALANAVVMAIEDLFDATAFVLKNADEFNVDKSKIILSGSSAGGITVLTAEHKMCNGGTPKLPKSFEYAGVITFSGAIFSPEKIPSYSKKTPPPMLLFHGDNDKIVPYNTIEFLKGGMFGSSSVAGILRDGKFPYTFYSVEGFGHSVSIFPMSKYLREVELFVKEFIFEGKNKFVNISLKDNDQPLDKNLDF